MMNEKLFYLCRVKIRFDNYKKDVKFKQFSFKN